MRDAGGLWRQLTGGEPQIDKLFPDVYAFALACARLYAEIAWEDPQPWKGRRAAAAQEWVHYRFR